MSWRKKTSLLIVALLLLAPVALLAWVITTQSGLRFAIDTLNRVGRIGPVTLHIDDVSGTLLRGARIGRAQIHHRRADILAQDMQGRVQLAPLFVRQIGVMRPQVARVEVTVLANPGPRPNRTPKFLPRLMRVDVYDASIDELSVTLISGRTLEFTHLSGDAAIRTAQIRVRNAQGEMPAMNALIHADGRLRAAVPLALNGDMDVDYTPATLPAWRFDSSFDGDLNELPLNITITAPFHAQLTGAAHTLTSGWRYDAKAVVQDFDLVPFGGSAVLGLISGTLDVAASKEGFTAQGSADPAGLGSGPFNVDFSGQYGMRRLEIRSANAQHIASGARITTSGEVLLREGGGQHLALTGDWSRFRWPLAGASPAFHSLRGRYTLTGDKPWQVATSGEVEALGLPSSPFNAQGTLETQRFLIADAQFQTLQGELRFSGETSWKPQESWRVEGQASNINPETLRPDLPGELNFTFNASGTPFGADGALSVSVANLRGQLRKQALSGHGTMARGAQSSNWQFDDVDLRLGRTQLQLNGSVEPGARDLRFVINAEDLSLLDPEARGQLNARGRWAGTTQAPLLQLNARGSNFSWLNTKLGSLNADLDIDLGAGQRAGGKILLERLQTVARDIQRATLTLDGTPASQHITLETLATPVKLELSARGAISNDTWRGVIDTVTLNDDRNLHLRLEQQTPLMLSALAASLNRLCLIGEAARLCGSGQFNAQQWNAAFDASQLPLAAMTAGLSSDIAYLGTINVQASARGERGVDPTGELHAQLQDATLERRLSNGRVERMALGSGEIDAIAIADALTLTAGLNAGESGGLTATLSTDRTVGEWRDHPLTGTLDMTTDGLGLVDIYVGDIDRASGRMTTKVNFGGTLGAPSVDGLLQLRDAQIDAFQVNLAMRDLALDAHFDTNRLELTGQSTLGGQPMHFSGNLRWQDREPYGQLKISGQNLLVVDVPEVVARASPDLTFNIAGRRIDVTGTLLLPEVKLEPADLTNAVLASSDEVRVGTPRVDPDMRWVVVSDVRVELGDNVHLEAFGLTGRLGGALNVRGDEFGVTRGQGELSIAEGGQYSAFGRKLDVTRGRLIFNNQLLGDPGVDLRAEKIFPEVTAGVNVRGTLREPRMTFYSEPSLPQWQIASLILAGGSLQSVQNSSSRNAASAVLLAQGGAMLAQHFGSQIGIQDVSLETDLNNESSLVFGRYLSPRLYISYGISLAEAINTLRLRYTLNNRWTVRLESGRAQSADIDYTILRGGARSAEASP
ncbi:MAG: translocation/assembly module TamB domain-containing protein [Nevskiaceae bacterium]|jgi:translocation and assembly module TamB|nr:translocation/assembly module TamB domain-containing protein [Nevskiaceae bacterium]